MSVTSWREAAAGRFVHQGGTRNRLGGVSIGICDDQGLHAFVEGSLSPSPQWFPRVPRGQNPLSDRDGLRIPGVALWRRNTRREIRLIAPTALVHLGARRLCLTLLVGTPPVLTLLSKMSARLAHRA